MNMVTRATRSRELSGTAEKINLGLDSAGILVGGANRLRQARGPVGHAAAANAQAQNIQDNYTSLDLENRRRWPISYRSIEIVALFVDVLTILSAGVLADTIYGLTTERPSEITSYAGAAAKERSRE